MTKKLSNAEKRSIILRIPVNKRERAIIEARVKKAGPFTTAAFVRWMALQAEMPK